MSTRRRAAAFVATALALATGISACSGGTGPATGAPATSATATTSASSDPTDAAAPTPAPSTVTPSAPAPSPSAATPSSASPSSASPSPSSSSSPSSSAKAPGTTAPRTTAGVASFRDTYRTAGVEIAVTHVKRTTLTAHARASHVAQGDPVQILTVRVHNLGSTPLAAAPKATVTYGRHAHAAAKVRAATLHGLPARIPAGQTRTGRYGFAVPAAHLYDATLHLRYAAHRAPAVFTGSLDYTPGNGTVFNDPMGSKAQTLAITSTVERSIAAAPPGSTIRIAHYSFDIQHTADTIVAAYRRGVHVQMIVDQHNQIVTKQTRTMLKVLGTRRSARSFIVRCRASCMSNHASAMHAKFYLFSNIGSARLVSMVSSANLTHTNSSGSWNDLQTIVGDATLYDSLKKYFVDMVPDKNRPNYYRTTTSGPYTLYFFPRARKHKVVLLGALDQVACTGAAPGYGDKDGHTVVRVMMYSWRGPRIDIAKKLWKLHDQGCTVQIILNSGRTDLAVKRALTKESRTSGRIQVRDAWVDRNGNNVAERYMHEKGITVNGVFAGRTDAKVVFSGSQNFAPASTTDNNELIMRHDSAATYDAYAANFKFIRSKGTRPLW